jgi:5'-3' exoribonuclease 1
LRENFYNLDRCSNCRFDPPLSLIKTENNIDFINERKRSMGVPYYFYEIFKKYNDEKDLVISEGDLKSKINPKYLFFDYNSLIHPCAKIAIDLLDKSKHYTNEEIETAIIYNCINYTRYIVSITDVKNVYIVIDGVAPRAKMNQQRQRRYKNKFLREIQKTEDNGIYWDTNKITPGTSFMEKLKTSLVEFKGSIFDDTGINIFISSSDEPGEGEHKMMRIINEIRPDENVCIYGLDADLIMLSLNSKYANRISLLRDNNKTNNKDNQTNFLFLNISTLRTCILKDIEFYTGKKSDNSYRTIQDYIFLLFFIGNDFVGHIPSLVLKDNAMGIILKMYGKVVKETNGYITDSNGREKINLENLKKFCKEIAKVENYFFTNVYSVYKKQEIYRDNINLDENYENICFYKNDIIKFNKPGYKARYYTYYGIPTTKLKDVCQNYLSGLFWIFGYYNLHEHDNWNWYYEYHAVPFMSDMLFFLEMGLNKPVEICPSKPFTEIEQLCMVLPRDSLIDILGERMVQYGNVLFRLTKLFRINSEDVERNFPTKLFLNMIHKEYIWQSEVFIDTTDLYFLNLILF